MPEMKKLPLEIELALMLQVTIVARDRDAANQCLRLIAEQLTERQSLAILQVTKETLDQQERAWLRGLY